jgi:hypothetical protein
MVTVWSEGTAETISERNVEERLALFDTEAANHSCRTRVLVDISFLRENMSQDRYLLVPRLMPT